MPDAELTLPAAEVVPGDVLRSGGTITSILPHDGLGGPFTDAAQAVAIELEIDYLYLKTFDPGDLVEVSRITG